MVPVLGAIIGWELLLLSPFIVGVVIVVVLTRRSGRSGRTGTPPAAGWHPDPTRRHQLRYWDGASWSDQVADQGQQATDPIDLAQG